MRDHLSELRRGANKSKTLQRIYDLYGEDGLEIKVLIYSEIAYLDYREQLVIDLYLKHGIPLLNISSNGTITNIQGIERLPSMISIANAKSIETRKTDQRIKAILSENGKIAMQRMKSNPDVERKRKKLAAIAQGRPELKKLRSETTKRLIADGIIPKFPKGNIPHNIYKVIHIPTGTEFDSMSKAAEWANVSIATMSRWVNGRIENGKLKRPKHRDWERKDL